MITDFLLQFSPALMLVFKAFFILIATLYFIFSLFIVRQINLMTETVITEGGPILRAFSLLHAGLALGVIILFLGFL